MTEYQNAIKQAMQNMYADARIERDKLREVFRKRDYEWHVSSEVYKELQSLIPDYDIYSYEVMKFGGIVVTCCPSMRGVKLVHTIGGVIL